PAHPTTLLRSRGVLPRLPPSLGCRSHRGAGRRLRAHHRIRASSANPRTPSTAYSTPSARTVPVQWPKHWCTSVKMTPTFVLVARSNRGWKVTSTSSPCTVHGSSHGPYDHSSSWLILLTRPSMHRAFSVMPVPSVHLPP